MNKRGFTLIELLAVIVILAIIALIATPIILNTIEKSRKNAAIDSAYGYVEAIEKQNALSSVNQEKYHEITTGEVASINSILKVKGSKPTSGNVTIEKGQVVSAELCISGYTVEFNGKEANVRKKCNEEKPAQVNANNVGFTPSNSDWHVSSVDEALDYLYQ